MSASFDASEWTSLLGQLYEAVVEQDWEDAIETCEELYDLDIPDPVKCTVVEIHCKCELHQEHYEDVLALCEQHKSVFEQNDKNELLQTLMAYSHYRLQRFEQARREISHSSTNTAQAHLEAQARYRLHDTSLSYSSLLQSDDQLLSEDTREEHIQTLVNAVAAELARATPYVELQPLPDELTYSSVDSWKDEERAYDLWYNLGTYQVLTSSNTTTGLSLLAKAERDCVATLEQEAGTDSTEITSEVAPIHYHAKSWSREWSGHAEDETASNKKTAPPSLQAIQRVNHALTHHSSSLPPMDPTWTALQQRLYQYNRAILQLRQKHFADCLHTCQAFLSASRKKDKGHVKLPPYASTQDEACWRAHIAVVQAHAQAPQHPDKAVKLLQEELKTLQQQESELSAMDHATAHVQLHLAHLEKRLDAPTDMVQVLQELPASIRQRKAVVATLASLHEEMGNHEEAMALLQEQKGGAAMVDFHMAQGEYEAAAKLCEESGDKVRLVEALSYIDPAKAHQVWEELRLDDDVEVSLMEELDGEELEERDLPRRSRKAAAAALLPTQGTEDTTKTNRKSREATLRRRARQKDAYLQKLISEGKYNPDRPAAPDPERWIPKHERSYNRRRRQRHQAKGHQGGGSEKDAAKLDVAARKGENVSDAGGAPSTAHLGVVGDSKRAGKRR